MKTAKYKHLSFEDRCVIEEFLNHGFNFIKIANRIGKDRTTISHPKLLPFSKPTFYKYIDLGLLNVRNIDLQRKVKFKIKKEYDYHRTKAYVKIKVNRFYTDFKDYIEYNPNASIVEMDTVIGTSGDKGGKCMLTF